MIRYTEAGHNINPSFCFENGKELRISIEPMSRLGAATCLVIVWFGSQICRDKS